MANEAKSASDFGTHRPRRIAEFIGENLILLSFELVTAGPKGEPLPYGPFYVIKMCIDNTGEMVEFVASNKYLMSWLDKVADPANCPINFRLYKIGKAFAIGDWE